ncbi:MAG: hypothetical protein IPG99_21870 [Ignavibacteria bacterium]|nr:hypothetical protein [Ignavibacteria bacterium]
MKHTSHRSRFFGPFISSAFSADCSLLPGQLHSQWIPQSIPVNKPITALEFTDSLNGWAVTGWGPEQDTCYILRTSNEGITGWFSRNFITILFILWYG